jgi:molybdopterin converting factor small subunit
VNSPPEQFEVSVLLFGPAAHAARATAVSVRLSPGATATDLLTALAHQHPAIKSEASVGRIAVDHAFVAPSTPITAGPELALISMVSGG